MTQPTFLSVGWCGGENWLGRIEDATPFSCGKVGFAAESSRGLVVKGRTCFEDVWLSSGIRVWLDFRGIRLDFRGWTGVMGLSSPQRRG